MQLFDAQGKRLYLTADERRAFIATVAKAERPVRTFCTVMGWTPPDGICVPRWGC